MAHGGSQTDTEYVCYHHHCHQLIIISSNPVAGSLSTKNEKKKRNHVAGCACLNWEGRAGTCWMQLELQDFLQQFGQAGTHCTCETDQRKQMGLFQGVHVGRHAKTQVLAMVTWS
jgi:hypothetical protein